MFKSYEICPLFTYSKLPNIHIGSLIFGYSCSNINIRKYIDIFRGGGENFLKEEFLMGIIFCREGISWVGVNFPKEILQWGNLPGFLCKILLIVILSLCRRNFIWWDIYQGELPGGNIIGLKLSRVSFHRWAIFQGRNSPWENFPEDKFSRGSFLRAYVSTWGWGGLFVDSFPRRGDFRYGFKNNHK